MNPKIDFTPKIPSKRVLPSNSEVPRESVIVLRRAFFSRRMLIIFVHRRSGVVAPILFLIVQSFLLAKRNTDPPRETR